MNAFATFAEPKQGESLLSTRAMLARISFSKWNARKMDKEASRETTERAGADAKAARVTKVLLVDETLEAIGKLDTAARSYLEEQSSPWLDNGLRLLSVANHAKVTARIREFREEREDLVRRFLPAYEADHASRAQGFLAGLYNPADYPAPAEMAKKFSMVFRLFPVPTAADWRVDISEESAAILRADLEAQSKEAMDLAVRDAYERIAESVGAMAQKLKAYRPADETAKAQGVFRDSLVDNVRDLAELLPVLNVTRNPALADLAAKIAGELTLYDAEELRRDDAARAHVATRAAAILEDVSAFLA